MMLRRVPLLLGLVTAIGAGWYFFKYLTKWEWNRALVAAAIFLALEIALVGASLFERMRKLDRSLTELRQSQAHAWDEVWLEGRGWVRVDPTSVVQRVLFAGTENGGGDGSGEAAWWLGWSDRLDVINRLWASAVVGFDALRQSTMFTPFGIPHLEWGELAIGLAAGIVVMLGLGLLVALHRPGAPPRDALDAAQRRLQEKLGKHGLSRQPQEGPRDFFARCMLALPASRVELAGLARAYLRLRYGHTAPPPEPVRAYSRAVRNFRARRVVK